MSGGETVSLIIVCWCVCCCLCCFGLRANQDFKEKKEDYTTLKATQRARIYFNGSGSDEEY